MNEPIKFRQMEYDREGFVYGCLFAGAGILFVVVGIFVCSQTQWEGLLAILFGTLFAYFGLSITIPYWRTLEIAADEIRLKLGSILLWKMPLSAIQGMGRSIICPNIRGKPWKADVIYLSFQKPTYIRGIERRRVTDAELAAIRGSDAEKERYIMQRVMLLYFWDRGSNMKLNKAEGTWLEYTPERASALKRLFPQAEYYID